ncbi:MAG: NAD-dependent epimerase/dehydratase family protein [Candidatus Omnitrophota bacterium]
MKRFLVTGGAGFIGSHIVESLVRKKQAVRVLDDFSYGRRENLKQVINQIELIAGDICSEDICLQATKGIDFVLHQAALRNVPKSLLNSRRYNEVNIQGTLNLLQASLVNKIKLFIFASSSSIYGDCTDMPKKEDSLPSPLSPYALTKLAGESYCKIFSANYNLPTVCLRYFNVYGPRQALDNQYPAVIPKFIDCISRNKPLPINGTGQQRRDFVFIKDVVDLNILVTKKTAFRGDIFNVSGGRDYSILEIADILKKISNKELPLVFKKSRPADVFKTFADLSKARKILGYKPQVNFVNGLKLTSDYFMN